MGCIRHSASNKAAGHNIARLQQMGRPHNQAVAIAMAIKEREQKRAFYRQHPGMSRMPGW